MAAVEQPFQSAASQVDRDRERDSAAARFTTVNGSACITSPPQTSFRPDPAGPSVGYYQHPLPGQAAPLERDHQPPHKPNEDEWDRRQSSIVTPSLEPRQLVHDGKRKRSLESLRRTTPSKLIRSNSPAALNPIAGNESPSRNLPPLLSYGHFDHSHSRDLVQIQQQQPAFPIYPELQTENPFRRDSHMYQMQRDQYEGGDSYQTQPGHHGEASTKKPTEPRKRKFSQRTKNGCHTCRGRKKKCDEGVPFCQNCIRGNFKCQGYGPKNELNVKLPSKGMPLQSKSSTGNASGYQPPIPVAPTEQWLEGQSRYPPEDQNRSRPFEDALRYAHRDGPRIMEPPDCDKPYSHEGFGRTFVPEPTRAPVLSRFSIMALSGSQTENGGSSGGGSVSGIMNDTRAGQLTLRPSISNHAPPRMIDTTEKENMLAGRLFRHFLDPHLMDERTWCKEALERFNNAAKALSGTSRDEREKLFRKIIRPQRLVDAVDPRFPVGSIGSEAIVEAPFRCDYGYNINIGENVAIQAGCVMSDPCRISIGRNTIVGQDVKFYGLEPSLDRRVRDGCRGRFRGGPITIEEDCFIGDSVVILPNVTIRRAAVVKAGTVVSRDVAPNTVVYGNPMIKLQDIGPSPDEEYNAQLQSDSNMGGLWPDRFSSRLP